MESQRLPPYIQISRELRQSFYFEKEFCVFRRREGSAGCFVPVCPWEERKGPSLGFDLSLKTQHL